MYGSDDDFPVQAKLARDVLNLFDIGTRLLFGTDLAVELLEIIPGAKGTTGSGQQDHVHGRVRVCVFKGPDKFVEELWINCVEAVGSV